MSTSNAGPIGRFFHGVWRVVDTSRRVVVNLIFLAIVAVVVWALARSGPPPLLEKTALVLALDGTITEQGSSGNLRSSALDTLRGEAQTKIPLRDVISVLDTAAADDKISSIVLILDELQPTGFATLREIAAGIERFRATGKKVVAWGSNYDQRAYFLAAHADEVALHPLGIAYITGFGRVRNYYKDALDKVGVTAHVIRAGAYKNAAEPYVASGPSPETNESDRLLYDDLWRRYTETVEKRRKLGAGSIDRLIAEAPQRLAAAGGDGAKMLLDAKVVDRLQTRDQLRAQMIERGAKDDDEETFRQVSFERYLARIRPVLSGDAIGVVVAEGEIVDGQAPAGSVGGLSTANLVRKAREDKDVKAVILRVSSPGGSVLGSELVRRELEITRAAGKPVVVSMGDVAASGGYWISLASDEIIADAATITGSIGVFALFPTFEQTLEKVGVGASGVATTWLRNADDPRLPLDPRLQSMIESNIDFVYRDFRARVAAARKSTPERIDGVAQGRVWTGAQALERGLVDKLGLFRDAVASAAARAKLGEKPRLKWIERDPGPLARLMALLNARVAAAIGEVAGDGVDATLGARALPRAAIDQARRELGWLRDMADRRSPFSSVVHCLCTNPL